MVRVDFYLDEDNLFRAMKFAGHAGSAPYGEDLVCSAISVISQTTVIGLEHFLTKKPEIIVEEGLLSCVLPEGLNQAEQAQAQVIFKTMELGLEALIPKYNKFFQICKRRWLGCL